MSLDRQLSRVFVRDHPADAARTLEALAPDEAVAALAELPPGLAARALQAMEASFAAACLLRSPKTRAAEALRELPAAAAARIAGRLDAESRGLLLADLPSEVADPIRRMVRHPAGTAGALMDPDVAALPEDITTGEARRRVRRDARRVLYYLYVTGREQRVSGVVNLRELMLAPADRTLGAVMVRPVTTLSAHARREAILAHPGWREFHALPVVDGSGVLLGVLRYETLRQLELEGGPEAGRGPLALGLALGEVYLTALTAMLQGMLDTVGKLEPESTKEERDGR